MGIREPVRTFLALLAVTVISLATGGCRAGRISGTYLAHGPNFVSMLELTQTDGGQITGVLNTINLHADGKIDSENEPITGGALDGEQLTLTFHPGVFGTNLAGAVKGNTIKLQTVGSNGVVLSWEFQRSSPTEFKNYADQLRLSAGGIFQTINLRDRTQGIRETIQNAEGWISNAELHAQRIPGIKDYYGKIEEKMRSLVAQERATDSVVERSQIAVRVDQGDVLGNQVDLQVARLWDQSLPDQGRSISQNFAVHLERCWPGAGEQFRKQGANPQAIVTWESACHDALTEQAKFEPIYKRIMEQGADLKSFQAAARSHRKALVDEARRIQ